MNRFWKKDKRLLCLCVVALATWTVAGLSLDRSDVCAHVFDLYGCTSRGVAMGSAMAGIAGDAAGLYYNPATISEVEDYLFSLSYFYADQTLKIDGMDTDVDAQSGLVIATVIPSRPFGIKVCGGALFYVPDKRLARYLLMPKDRPRFVLYSNEAQRLTTLLPVAIQITSWLSIGAGVSFLMEMSGKEELFVSESWTGRPSVGKHAEDFRPVFAPYGGVLFKCKDWLRLGISYADKSEFRIEVTPVVILPDMYVDSGMPIPLIRQTRIDAIGSQASHFSPAQLVTGLSVRLLSRLTLATSLSWVRWSQFEEYAPSVKLILSGPPGNLGDWVDIFEYPIPPPDFHDIIVPAAGVEYRALTARHIDLDVRVGYFYRPTPVPAQTGVTNFIDSDIHAPSFGLGVTLKDLFRVITKPLSLDVHFQYQLMTKRRTIKEDPGDPVGDYESSGSILNIGGTMTVRF